jgi:purine-binding chemotaxis protein CheW
MDFLEIRRKAKERAAARAAAAARHPSSSPTPEAAGVPTSPLPEPPGLETARPMLELDPLPLPPVGPSDPGPLGLLGPEPESAGPAPSDPEALRQAREAAEETARTEAALVVKVQELPTAPDARFRTWRPSLDLMPELAPIAPEADDDRGRDEGRENARRRRDRPLPPADPLDEFFYRADEPGPDLGALATAPAAPAPASEPLERDEYLTFLLGAEEYGVEIGRVREVMRSPPITEVPRAPADVLGVITVRGEVVAVVDPRRRLGLPPGGSVESGRVIIVDDGRGAFGLLVDAVANVVRMRRGSIEPCPPGMGGASADCLDGIGRDHDRIFTVLAVSALLRPTRRVAEGRV